MSGAAHARFLARASRLYGDGDWVFTGFHWPILAMTTARHLRGESFVAVFEAGAALAGMSGLVPTSTTDYPAYVDACTWLGDSNDALLALPRRYDRVVLDATNVDVRGAVNATAVGSFDRPEVRLAGGGGAADAAAGARELWLLNGRTDATRLVERVDNVTAWSPAPSRLVTPFAVIRLGAAPAVEEWLVDDPDPAVAERLTALGVASSDVSRVRVDPDEIAAADEVLRAAASRGYAVARRALAGAQRTR